MEEKRCVGCENIAEMNYPFNGYSQVRKCYIMNVMETWHDENGKWMRQVDVGYCPVCGKKLGKRV